MASSNDSTADAPLTAATVRAEFVRMRQQWDEKGWVSLMTRYLSQPLSDSETAWAYKNLANAFAVGGRSAEAVHAHETFELWLPGKSPRLSTQFPYYPAPDDSHDATMGPDEIRVHFLAQSVQFATSYGAIGRYDDFLAKADAAISGLTPTAANLRVRFYGLLIFMTASQVAGDFERAEQRVPSMHAVADQAEDPAKSAELHALALTYEIQLARARNDSVRVAEKLQQALSLLAELEKSSASEIDLRGYRFELAHHLIGSGRHEAALPLLDADLAAGRNFYHGYGWLMHAAAVWRVTRDRSRALALLRQAPRDYDTRNLADDFRATPGFEDVIDDPEFLQSVSRSV
jgi:hypothetical protein